MLLGCIRSESGQPTTDQKGIFLLIVVVVVVDVVVVVVVVVVAAVATVRGH